MWEAIINFSLEGLVILISIFSWVRLKKPDRFIFLFVFVTMLFELIAFSIMKEGKNNLIVFHFLTPVQVFLQVLFFNSIIRHNRIKIGIKVSATVLIFFILINTFFLEHLNSYDSLSIVIKSFAVTIYSLMAIIDVFHKNKNTAINLKRLPEFWMISGFLLQALGSFFFEGVMNYLIQKNNNLSLTFYFINVSIGFLLYILFIIGLLTRLKFDESQ